MLREIGIPVRSASWVRLFAGTDEGNRPAIYAVMGQSGNRLFILQIDPSTGRFTQHLAPSPASSHPTAAFWSSRWKALYIGSAWDGCLYRFDPKRGALENLGEINPGLDTFPCRIDESPDGSLWIGCYPTASLTRFDPAAATFTRYGRMDESDMYFYPFAGDDGTVAGLVRVMRPHCVAIDPRTGERKVVGPVADTNARKGSVNLRKASDGKLYIVSSEGSYRIDGTEVVEVESVPQQPHQTLPDGSTFKFADADRLTFRELEITSPDGQRRTYRLDWEGAGTQIFVLSPGPDGCVYGSSYLPLHLFRYNPSTGELVDFGRASLSSGQIYSMGTLDGLLYMCSYPGARLSVYDPSKPYRFGTDPDANPRDIGRMDNVSFRPVSMLAGPLGRIWTGSYPDYGMWGGPLSWYDPQTQTFGSCREVLKDQSVCALAWIEKPGLIAGGTSIQGGTGTMPKATQAGFFLWQPEEAHCVWRSDLNLRFKAVIDLVSCRGCLAYAVITCQDAHHRLLLIDFGRRKVLSFSSLPPGVHPLSITRTERGDYFGFTAHSIFSIKPGTTEVQIIHHNLSISCPGPVIDRTAYFASGARLLSIEL